MSGDFAGALKKTKNVWASFPDAPYGQQREVLFMRKKFLKIVWRIIKACKTSVLFAKKGRHMRIWIFWITLFFVGGTKSFLFGDGLYKVAVRTKQEKYLRGGSEEQITFYVPKDDTSHEMVARKGLLIKRPQAQATVLICHGFMCSKYETSFVRSIFGPSDDGLILNTMIFDFRAHGEDSQGQTCSFGKNEALDVIAAAQFLKNQPDLQGKPLIVYGFSMGAVASILAQSQRQNLFDFAIWDCPFDSFSNVINRAVDKLSFTCCGYEIQLPGRKFFNRYAYNPMCKNY